MAKRARRNGQSKGRRRPPPPPPSFLKENWRGLAIVVVLFMVIAVSAYIISPPSDEDDNGNGNGPPNVEKAPEFIATTVDGEPIALAQFRGQVVVLDLMATWCGPCADQMEELNKLQGAYHPSEVVIISIGVDTSETDQQLRTFRDQHYANWRFASDTDNVGTKYNAKTIPTLAIIDKDGNLQWRHAGLTSFEDLQVIIDPLV